MRNLSKSDKLISMKRILSIKTTLWVLLLILAGCANDGDTPEPGTSYYFRYEADGVQHDYGGQRSQVNLTGILGYDANTATFSINIAGIRNIAESGRNTLTIFVSDTDEFPTGINFANLPGEGDDYPDFLFSMGYYDNDGNLYIAGGQGDSPIYAELYEPAFVRFSEITETHISGTFSGMLIWYDNANGTNEFVDSVEISDGEFKVPRVM